MKAGANSLKAPQSLSSRVLRAGTWTVAGFAASQLIRFASNLVLTRLLAPDLFGVMTIAFSIMFGLTLFSDFGLRQSVVQSPRGHEPVFLNTVWVTKAAIGAGLALCALAAGGVLAALNGLAILPPSSAYAHPALPHVVAALGLGAFIGSWESTKALEASRNLQMASLIKLQLLAQLVGLDAMLVAATVTRSVWVLVIGGLVTTTLTTVASHVFLDGVSNRLQWDRACFKEMLRFGKWILLSSAVGFLALATDKFLLGAVLTASALGVYSIASLIVSAVDQLLSKPVNEVAFPAMSEVSRSNPQRLSHTIYKFHLYISGAAYFLCGLLAVSAPSLIHVLYDTRYQEAGWMLQVLSVALIAIPSRLHAASFLARGKSKMQFALAANNIVMAWIAIPVGFWLGGAAGAIWGYVGSQLFSTPLILALAARQRTLDLKREFICTPVVVMGVAAGMLVRSILP
jgi:O-antigen/teichoic acid export membrane protein